MIGSLAATFIWMDGSDKDVEDDFKWWDGESINNGYTHWVIGEPDSPFGPEYCMALSNNNFFGFYKWLDLDCDISDFLVYTLCQKDVTVIHA